MKNVALLFLLTMLAIPGIAQELLEDYPLKSKPVFTVQYLTPWPEKETHILRAEQPCTVEVHTTIGGKEMDRWRYEVSLENDQGTVEPVPGHPNQFIITPRTTSTRSRIRVNYFVTTPGHRLMIPIAKPDVDSRVYDRNGNIVPSAIQGWEPLPNVDANGRFLVDSIILLVVNPKN